MEAICLSIKKDMCIKILGIQVNSNYLNKYTFDRVIITLFSLTRC